MEINSNNQSEKKNWFRIIGNVILNPCVLGTAGLTIANASAGGLLSIGVGVGSEPVYIVNSLNEEIKGRPNKEAAVVTPSIPPSAQGAFRTVSRATVAVNLHKAFAGSSYSRSLKIMAALQAGMAVSDGFYSGASLVMAATLSIAYGNLLESIPEHRRKAVFKNTLRRGFPCVMRHAEGALPKWPGTAKVKDALVFCALDSHLWWTAGLTYMAKSEWAAALFGLGLSITLVRGIASKAQQQQILQGLNNSQKIRDIFVNAKHDTTALRAAAWTANKLARGLGWLLETRESPVLCTAAAFAVPFSVDAVHMVAGMPVDYWNTTKDGCYMATQLSVAAIEKFGGPMEAIFHYLRREPTPAAPG